MKVLIADDEEEVLKGLKRIIDWAGLGFTVCGEATTGTDTLQKINILNPDLVLLDIRMPHLTGLEIIKQSRELHFKGHFIILSGYSDFSYAQTAVKLDVDNYLLKPVDEEELTNAVIKVRMHIDEQQKKDQILHQYRENARTTILQKLITEEAEPSVFDLEDLHLLSDQYMIVLYERYNQNSFQELWSFADLLHVGNQNHTSFEQITIDGQNVILLKGTASIERFYHILDYYKKGPQKDSPLDALFLMYGRPVSYITELHISYKDALQLRKRRFFCMESQHILSYEELPTKMEHSVNTQILQQYPVILAGYIQSHNRSLMAETLMKLEKLLYSTDEDINSLKRTLIDIFLQVKQILCSNYSTIDFPLPNNAAVIEFIQSKNYLYEIIQFFSEQFEMCIKAIGYSNVGDIMDDVLYYINHNYSENLRLESIAPLFGYNSSYLGKIFNRKTGENFNSYLDKVRIENAKKLLAQNKWKVYEISEMVGYKSSDYFHKKFRKYTNTTPAEYRKSLQQNQH
ncbi:MAG: response regulator [Oliverpabstia sp.]